MEKQAFFMDNQGMPHPVNRRQMPGWKQVRRRPPSPPRPQGGCAKRPPGRKITPPAKPKQG
jgi:hypothetical protein